MGISLGTKLGPYEIQSPVGAGGMGEVYRALDTRLDRAVAIKVLTVNGALLRERGTATASNSALVYLRGDRITHSLSRMTRGRRRFRWIFSCRCGEGLRNP